MSMIEKIRTHGFLGTIKAVFYCIADVLNKVFFYFAWLKPIDDDLIVLESEGDLTDNAYALYDHMRRNGYLKKYRVVWLVDDVKRAKENHFPNTDYVKKYPRLLSYKRSRYLAMCRWYIYDHCNVLSKMRKRERQTIVYLSHGWGYKAAKGAGDEIKTHYDYLIATGSLSAMGLSTFWQEPIEKAVVTGYPRIDYFFRNDLSTVVSIKRRFKLEKYQKIIFWMPTFRKSVNRCLSEEYIDNKTGLPLFYDIAEIKRFSDFLKSINVVVILKVHQLQAELDVFSFKFDNLMILRDEDIHREKLQLYEFIPIADALITDYSSIAIDYMVLDRPLIYILDDYKEYAQSRGLFPENAIEYMPGYHVYTVDELKSAVTEICEGEDFFAEDRRKLTGQYHKYLDGNSSRRVIELLNL